MNYKNDAIFNMKKTHTHTQAIQRKEFNREQSFSLSAELLSRLVNNELWFLVCVVTLNRCKCTTMLKNKAFWEFARNFSAKTSYT